MGSQSSKFGPESVVGSKRDQNANFISSNSKGGIETKIHHSRDETTTKDTNLVNTSFKWTYGGNSVFVTGTFTGWKDHVPLQKVGTEYNTIVRLPKGIYYYKFIVDGEWKFSPDDLTAPDEHGNINNIIDTTTVESMNKIIESTDLHVHRKTSTTSGTVIRVPRVENPFTEEAPPLPAHLLGAYFLNEKDKKLKNQKSLLKSYESLDAVKEEYIRSQVKDDPRREFIGSKAELAPPTHVTLNHLCLKGPFGPDPKSSNYCVTTMTQRFKSKYATIQFYSAKFSQVH